MTAARLKHDAQGFLTGDPIDLGNSREWDGLREDVCAIRAGVSSLGEALKHPDFPYVALPGSAANDADKPLPAQTTVSLDLDHSREWYGLREDVRAGAPSLGEALKRPDFERVAVPGSMAYDADKSLPIQPAASPNLERSREWDGLRDDVRAIRVGVSSLGETLSRPDFAHAVPKAVSPQMHAARQAQANQQKRGNDGRFISKSAPETPSDDGEEEDRGGGKTAGAIRSLGNKIAEVVKTSGDGAQEVDPAVKSFTEVARPLARGYQIMRGSPQKRQESWLRRIYTTLKETRQEGGLFHKVASKRLKAIEEKKTGSGGHGWLTTLLLILGGLLARFLGKLPLIGPVLSKLGHLLPMLLPKRWRPEGQPKGDRPPGGKGKGKGRKRAPEKARKSSPAGKTTEASKKAAQAGKEAAPLAKEAAPLAKEAGAFGKVFGGAGKVLGGAGKLAKGLLRRVPLLGNLLAVGAAGMEIAGNEQDDTLSRREKDQRNGGAVGGAMGGIAGMLTGAEAGAAIGSLAGPIGTVIGGLVGGAVGLFFGDKAGRILGDVFGGWVNDLRKTDLGGKMFAAWGSLTQSIKTGWGEIVPVAQGTWDWIKESFGDVADWAKGKWDGAVETFGEASDWVKKKWDGAVKTFGEVFREAGELWDKTVGKVGAAFSAFGSFLDSVFQSLKSLPVVGPAIQKIENAAKTVAQGASAVKDTVVQVAGQAKDKALELGGKVVDAAKTGVVQLGKDIATVAAKAVPQRLMDHIEARREERRQEQAAASPTEKPKSEASKSFESGKQAGGSANQRYDDAKPYLLDAAGKAGVDAGTLAKIVAVESGFRAGVKNPNSSAFGYGQFTDATWNATFKKYAGKYGVDPEQAGKYRNDESAQAWVMAEFTRENIAKGRKYGGGDDDANVYAFHNLGDGDAIKLLSAIRQTPSMTVRDALLQGVSGEKNKSRIESVISGNSVLYGDGNISAAQAYANMGRFMRKGDVYAADIRKYQGGGDPAAGRTAFPAPPVLAQAPAAPAMQTVVASASVPSVPSIPSPPPIQPAPLLTTPLASSGSVRPIQVALPSPEIGQDLADRRMAHIVTGGLSSA